ncbi:MAG: hypothetical protein HOL48_07505 [Porticoccaceae bacterium]|jgi:hypothetical protein|nr:hypothetical protein [Porticoccaceae bacterium]
MRQWVGENQDVKICDDRLVRLISQHLLEYGLSNCLTDLKKLSSVVGVRRGPNF